MIFQRGLGGGRTGALEGSWPAAPRQETSAAGTSGAALWPGKRGWAARYWECVVSPQDAPSLLLGCKGHWGHIAPSWVAARRSPRGHKVADASRVLVSLPPLFRARDSRLAPAKGRGGIRAGGGSLGARGEPNRRPAYRRRTPEPGDPAIDSNGEAAVYSNTAPPGLSPGDAARPGAPSARPGRPPSSLPRGLGLPGPAAATPAA